MDTAEGLEDDAAAIDDPVCANRLLTLRQETVIWDDTGYLDGIVGAEELIGMTQPTVSNIIHEVAEAIIVLGRRRKLVEFALTPAAKVELKAGFARRGTIPGVLACVDGTLVAIGLLCAQRHGRVRRRPPHTGHRPPFSGVMPRLLGVEAPPTVEARRLTTSAWLIRTCGEAPSDTREDGAELPHVPLSHGIYLTGRQQRNALVSLFQCVRGVLGDSALPAPQDCDSVEARLLVFPCYCVLNMAYESSASTSLQFLQKPHQREDVELFDALQEKRFRNTTLSTTPTVCEPHTFHIKGGLMSGLRSTSTIESGWNAVLGRHVIVENVGEVEVSSVEPSLPMDGVVHRFGKNGPSVPLAEPGNEGCDQMNQYDFWVTDDSADWDVAGDHNYTTSVACCCQRPRGLAG
ncbi:hypothetical protein MTO96_029611 [Rhipicephalus appendiculatus]